MERMKGTAFKIRGMDCAEETAVLKRAVGPLVDGEDHLAFDALNAKMTVLLPRESVDVARIREAVAAAGMEAVLWEGAHVAEGETFWQRHGRLTMAAVSGAMLLEGFVAHAILHEGVVHALVGSGGAGTHSFPAASIALYVCAAIAGAWFVAPKAWKAAVALRPDMNLLMTVAVIGAMGIGEWLEAAMVAFLFAVALLLEHWSVGRARRAISALMDLSPVKARCLDEDGTVREKDVADVAVGETVLVRPGEKVPVDGEVTEGSSNVNQAPITGESSPVPKSGGDDVFAGTLNEDGALEIRVTKQADDTTLARIVHMVEEARSRRAASEQWVEKFARYYTPAMMALALATALGPPLVMSASWAEWLYRGLVILVIACPCALVISTPVSVVSGLAAAARNGVLIKGGVYLETAGRLNAIAFDKTGTLTYGHPEVREIAALHGHSAREALERAASLEANSEHPLARAILRKAAAEGLKTARVEDFRAVKGEGVEARIGGRDFWIGSHRMMEAKGQETPEAHDRAMAMEEAGHSVVALGNDEHVCGLMSVADAVRENAAEAVAALRGLGVRKTVMLTGDNAGTAEAVASAVGVDEYRSELLPQEKLDAVASLAEAHGCVAMVGDGVNDAPAMAASHLGIAMGAIGTDAAIETADVALMSDDLSKLPWLIGHSRRALGVIRQNIVFALAVKGVFISLAFPGLATLWMAIAADMGASLLVIFNGLRLLRRGSG